MPFHEKRYKAGDSLEDYCRACKTDRMHTVVAADDDGRPIRVSCGFCHSEHNYRGGPRVGLVPGSARANPLGAEALGAEAAKGVALRETDRAALREKDRDTPREDERARERARRAILSGSPQRQAFPIVSERERTAPPMAIDHADDLELLLRRI